MNEHPQPIRWQEHRLARPDVALAWFDAGPRRTTGGEAASAHGTASPLVFLHGGPGMDHRYLEPAAAPLADVLRCVLYDQRGDGASPLGRPLNASERAEYATLRQQSRDALAAGDAAAYRALQQRRNDLHARCWFYSPEAAARHTAKLLALIEDPWAVAQRTSLAGNAWRDGIWDRVRRIGAPTLVMYGYQDYEPIMQACCLAALLPRAQICLINECSHWVWLEQPAAFETALRAFLTR
jgi:pimeloyl-ACP methyl ester carboxylesterase